MSVQATSWVWTLRGLPTHLRLTLLAIADACDAEGYGYPGHQRLGQMCECSERQIRKTSQNWPAESCCASKSAPAAVQAANQTPISSPLCQQVRAQASGTLLPLAHRRQPELQDRATGTSAQGNRNDRTGALKKEP